MTNSQTREITPRRSPLARFLMAALLTVLFAIFLALGIWQVQRLAWKLDLIARVDARVHAVPIAAPTRSDWSKLNAAEHEYLRVRATGSYEYGKDVLVQALTERGAGFWVMTPLRLADGTPILVNRGFVPSDRRMPADRRQGEAAGPVTVTGLLRISEPNGSMLRSNDPAADLWYSRDVAAILRKQGISEGAPYFIDADATLNAGGLPLGGLTVVSFTNNHLVYAITWFALALMVAGAIVYLRRSDRRTRSLEDGI